MTARAHPIEREFTHAHLFCGLGGGARGFNRGRAELGGVRARFRCLGGVDVDAAAIADFAQAAGVRGTVIDLFDAEQHRAFHGRPPPPGWREATPQDLHAAWGHERPDALFLSAPCKGFSGLLAEATSLTDKYQALNALTLRGVFLALEAYASDPVPLIVFENVPRIASRGRALLDRIGAMLAAYGYAVAETTHDCGRLGNLAQSRKRFLLVARHREKVPPMLYEPAQRPLRGVGEVLGRMPMPGDPAGGAMHRIPSLQWRTWVRLAFVEAGQDWRSLNRLRVEGGALADYGIAPDAGWNKGVLGVRAWDAPAGVVCAESKPTNGAFAVADPRVNGHAKSVQHGVRAWDAPSCVVTSKMLVGGGPHAVADPRTGYSAAAHCNIFSVVPFAATSGIVTGSNHVTGGALSVADPREADGRHVNGKYRVTAYDEPAGAVIAASTTGNGAYVVADPRPACLNAPGREAFRTGGHYGVVDWTQPSGAVPAWSKNNNGPWSVADPRDPVADAGDRIGLPEAAERLVAVIRAIDGTWHRPFTTLELAALQGLVEPEEALQLHGLSDSAWRERIGNAVPPPAAEAIANVCLKTLLMAEAGVTFALSAEPIWVRPIATALAVDTGARRT